MNKTLIFGCALAFLGLSACSNDDMNAPAPAGSEVDVYFSASLPTELLTRAEIEAGYGDGTHAQNLQFAVYDKYGKYLFRNDQTYTFDATLHTQVKIRLVSGETYQIAFWAQNENAPYSFNVNNATVTADYTATNFTNNMEDMDAFFVTKTVCIDPLEPQLNQFAELTRATAQINIATADKSYFEGGTQAGLWPANSKLTLKNVPTAINLLDGSLTMPDNPEEETVFPMATLPTGKITVNNKKYDYLSLTYVLAPADGTVYPLVSMEVDKQTNGKRQYKNIPVRRNWQTNIVGNLLTSETLWDVYIRPAFEDEYNILISTEAELISALKEGGNYTLTQDLTIGNDFYTTGEDVNVNINLNGQTITLTNGSSFCPYDGSTLTMSNGNIVNNGNYYAFYANHTAYDNKSTLVLEGINLTNSVSTAAIGAFGKADVTLKKCKINAKYFGLTTNASTPDAEEHNFVVEDCEFVSSTPVLLNVPCNLTMKNTKLTGWSQGLVMRGGTAEITGGEIVLNYALTPSLADKTEAEIIAEATTDAAYFNDKNWGQGNMMNVGALVMGNKVASSSTSYRYPTNVTLKGVKVACEGVGADKFPTVYMWANDDNAANGVTFTYDAATTFVGGTGIVQGNNGTNITVNAN